MDKVVKLFSDFRIIYTVFFAMMISGYNVLTWAGDQRYVTISNYQATQIKRDIRRLNNKIAELKIRLQYANNQRDKDMIRSLIINTEAQIKNLKGE